MSKEVKTIEERPVLVELVCQKVIVFKNAPEDAAPEDLVNEAVRKDLVDLADFDPIYFNACDAEKDGSEAGWAPASSWGETWPWTITGNYNVQTVDMDKPRSAPLCIKVRCEAPSGLSADELTEELKIRLMSSDGEQHLETMNWEPLEDVSFTVVSIM